MYLILYSQANMTSCIIGNMVSGITAQIALLNDFENVVNHRVAIREEIKHYQNTLSYALSKVDYRMGFSMSILPSEMNLNITPRTAGYNNKILISNGIFNLFNASVPSHKTPIMHTSVPKAVHTLASKSHEEERVALVLVWPVLSECGTSFVNERYEMR